MAAAEHCLTPLEIIGEVIAARCGPSRVLVIGAAELAEVIAGAGHEVLDVKDYARAAVVAVGNDFDLTYERLTAAARAARRGALLITPNLDVRLPIEGGEFLPGCGAIVAAVAAAAGAAAMVGDSVPSDIRGARAVGMTTVFYAPAGGATAGEADVIVGSFAELARLAGVA